MTASPTIEETSTTPTTTPAEGGENFFPPATNSTAVSLTDDESDVKAEEDMSETEKLLKKVKEAGTAGVVSYALWELAFWLISIPVCVVAYTQVTG